MYLNLCKEGISYHNAVAHHKYANSLILELRNQELKNDLNFRFRESINHLKESINRGFIFSYFYLAMLYYEFFKDEQLAYITAQKGDEKEEKYSKC